MTIRRRLLVSGRVQGVFYRDTCRRIAEENGVAGSASNLADGRVEVILEGDTDAVERVVALCRSGTSHSRVDDVEVEDQRPVGQAGFSIS